MVRRYLVTGLNGQVAQSLIARANDYPGVEIVLIGRPTLDLLALSTIERNLIESKPDLIISAAAYTAVDAAEKDCDNAFAVNAVAVGEIGKVAARHHIPVIHLSTDYVFSGDQAAAYKEEDPVNPLGVYGRSKLQGEEMLIASGADHAILRTAWVYSPFGKNFLKTMLRVAAIEREISVVCDQFGNPTSALDIADGILKVASNLLASNAPELRGRFHMAGTGEASWADFAEEIFNVSGALGGPTSKVNRIRTSEYPTAAKRPQNSNMCCDRIKSTHNVEMQDWRIATKKLLRIILNQ